MWCNTCVVCVETNNKVLFQLQVKRTSYPSVMWGWGRFRVSVVLTARPSLHRQDVSAGFLLFRPTQKYRSSLRWEEGITVNPNTQPSFLSTHNCFKWFKSSPGQYALGDAFNLIFKLKSWMLMQTKRQVWTLTYAPTKSNLPVGIFANAHC